jgi:hypothetical protein
VRPNHVAARSRRLAVWQALALILASFLGASGAWHGLTPPPEELNSVEAALGLSAAGECWREPQFLRADART